MLHVLVALDGSEHSMAAVRWVARHGQAGTGVRCTLINVQKPVMAGEVGMLAPASIALDERGRRSAEILEQAAAVMRGGEIPFVIEERMDAAAAAIVARAQALSCDAIVMGRRGLGVVRAALLGSVSADVVRSAGVPVIVVRALGAAGDSGQLRILLAADGSDNSTRAAAFASRLASACRGEVELVHVEPGLTVAGSILGPREKLVGHWSGKHAREALAGARGLLDQARVKYTEHVVANADTHRAIIEVAGRKSCGLIAMGTRGLGTVTGLLLGSVAQGVLEHAPPTVAAVALVR